MEQTLSAYYVFYTTAACSSISKAAEKLFISQPAVSKSIQKLEDSLGCRLFLRSSRGVTLTEEGSLLYAHVKSAIDTLLIGEEKVKRSVGLGIGHLKIGASSTLCKYVLLPYLKGFIEENPNISISISCQPTSETLRMIADDKLDIGLVGIEKDHVLHSLHFDYISEIEDIFTAAGPYLQNLKRRGISDEQILQNCSLLLLDKNNLTRQYIDDYLRKNQIVVQECISASTMDLLIEFAKISLGAACVIRQFVEAELADGTLIEVPLPKPIQKRSIGFAYKTQQTASKPMEKFIHFYRQNELSSAAPTGKAPNSMFS